MRRKNRWLLAAGVMTALAAALHLAIIAGGPQWYRFFGAGERMARMAELGRLEPTLITLAIAAVLAVWVAYAFAGAGLIRRLPLMRPALVAISAILLLRGVAPLPVLVLAPARVSPFLLWSSLVVLALGATYAVGTWRDISKRSE